MAVWIISSSWISTSRSWSPNLYILYSEATLNCSHSWDVLGEILNDERCQDILIDVGMPVLHTSCLYNCRVIFRNKRILLIRVRQISNAFLHVKSDLAPAEDEPRE